MPGLSLVVKSFFDALTKMFSYAETSKEHQAETDVLRDKRKLKKCSDVAEDILFLALKYRKSMTPADQRKLIRLTKQFKKNN